MLARLIIVALACSAAAGLAGTPSPPLQPSAPRFITAGSGFFDYWPCFSPDGKYLLFSRSLDGGRFWELWIVGAAGGEPRKFARAALAVSATRASWSPKNHLIAFTGTSKSGRSSVWVISPDGTNPHEQAATGLSERVFYPSWYPDGALAVMDGAALVIRRIDPVRGSVATLTTHDRILTGMPSVSPDGRWIAFAGQPNAGQRYDQSKNTVWLLDLSSGALRSLERTPAQGRAPTWSPDGRRLAFESDRDSFLGRYAVFVIDRDGGGLRQITDYGLNATHPVWSPDGRRLVFAARSSWLSRETRIATVDLPAR